jgi:hypothetical protein
VDRVNTGTSRMENPKKALIPYTNTLLGAIDDGKGRMFVLFMRSRQSPIFSVSRILAQAENGDVFEVSKCVYAGLIFKSFFITLTGKSGNLLTFFPKKFLEVQKGCMVRGLAVASTSAEFRTKIRDNWFPPDFWNPIPENALNENDTRKMGMTDLCPLEPCFDRARDDKYYIPDFFEPEEPRRL